VVLPSIYEEEIEAEDAVTLALVEQGAWTQPEASGYFPERYHEVGGLDARLETIVRARAACAVPVIASLNGSAPAGWVDCARDVELAGASAIELNLYRVPADLSESGATVERRWLETVAAVRAAVALPLAVKLGPWLSSPGHFAGELAAAGADALVLFNRFYQPDIDLDEMSVVPRVSLSHPSELRLPLRWTAILRPQLGGEVSIAASSGIHDGHDAVKALMVGADVAMMTSALLRHGPAHVQVVEAEMRAWLDEHEYGSVGQLRGSASQGNVGDPTAFERAQYIRTLHSWTPPREQLPVA
jgi:dihydroorotate dehydrogenase (fumarate)